jgi:hypothetical protein
MNLSCSRRSVLQWSCLRLLQWWFSVRKLHLTFGARLFIIHIGIFNGNVV